MQKIHFIAIGGRAMHNLAITLKKNNYTISGSDDEIYDPSYSNLKKHALLPAKLGWFPERITPTLDAVILGRHATNDNPELKKAQELGIRIFSYPEFIYYLSKHKQRIVIAGSHGKNTIATIVMHVLSHYQIDYDFVVSARANDIENTINLTEKNNIIIIEGDEQVTTTIDFRSKFEHYKPHIALLSGIAWGHVQAFPTFDSYLEQFKKYVQSIEPLGRLIYNNDDPIVRQVIGETHEEVELVPYTMHPKEIFDNKTFLKIPGGRLPVLIFGEHNMRNIAGAIKICQYLKISEEKFYKAFKTFKGTSKHLQLIGKNKQVSIYQDFAYSPTKLNFSIKAIREQFPKRELIACVELSSHKSLHSEFLKKYSGIMNLADEKIVFINKEAIEQKSTETITEESIRATFGSSKIKIYSQLTDVKSELYTINWTNKILLLMNSSSNSTINYREIAQKIILISNE